MNYKKFRCVLRLSDKDWRIWRLWLTISCLHSSTCESWSPPIYCWRSSSKHCQSSKHSGRVCHTLSAQSSLSIFVNAKILILSYKISIFAIYKDSAQVFSIWNFSGNSLALLYYWANSQKNLFHHIFPSSHALSIINAFISLICHSST